MNNTLKIQTLAGITENNNIIYVNSPNVLNNPGTIIGIYRHEWFQQTVVSGGTWVDAVNASITITPKLATSRLYINSELSLAPFFPGTTYAGMAARILRDGNVITRQNQTHEVYISPTNNADIYSRTVKSVVVNSNNTSPTTFSIQIAGYASTNNARLNQADQWSSCITIFEVAS